MFNESKKQVTFRIPLAVVGFILITVLGLGCLIAEILSDDAIRDVRLFDVTLAAMAVIGAGWVGMLALRRVGLLVAAYTAGYRHGRNDANMALLDSGLMIAEDAEVRERRRDNEDGPGM